MKIFFTCFCICLLNLVQGPLLSQQFKPDSIFKVGLVLLENAKYGPAIYEFTFAQRLAYLKKDYGLARQIGEASNKAYEGYLQLLRVEKNRADSLKEIAIKQREQADSLRYLSTAQALAATSLQLTDDTLKALLALQAYQYHVDYNGNASDNIIYQGLFEGLRALSEENFNRKRGMKGLVKAFKFSPEYHELYSLCANGDVCLWSRKSNLELQRKQAYSSKARLSKQILTCSAARWLLIVNATQPYIELIDTQSGQLETAAISQFTTEIEAVCELPANRGFLIKSKGDSIRLLDPQSTKIESFYSIQEELLDIAVFEDKMAFSNEKGALIIVNLSNGAVDTLYNDKNDKFIKIAFNYDGTKLAAGSRQGKLFLWSLPHKKALLDGSLSKHLGEISDVKFNKEGSRLATASQRGIIHLWEIERIEAEKRLPIIINNGRLRAPAVIFDELTNSLIIGEPGGMSIWPVQLNQIATELCTKLAGKQFSKSDRQRFIGLDMESKKISICRD